MIESGFNAFPVLSTERLLLRQLSENDSKDLYNVLSDEEVARFYDDDAFSSISQANEQIAAWNTGYARHVLIRWGICTRHGNRVIGTCGYYGLHTLHLRASIGYELHRQYWRQGIMTEALERIIQYGMEILDLRRIQAFVMPGNEGSMRLLTKLGFRNEGLLREYETWGTKGFVDLLAFSLLHREWSKEKG